MKNKRKGASFCSTLCRIKAYRKRKGIPEPFSNTNAMFKVEDMILEESMATYGKKRLENKCCSQMKLEILPDGNIECASCKTKWKKENENSILLGLTPGV